MSRAFVALGSSIEPAARMAAAARALKARFADARFSTCYRNAPFGFEGPDFINAVVEFSTALPVPALLAVLHEIEAQCGRGRDDPKWAPRAMDLDLLLYDDLVASAPGFTLPRPDLLERVYMLGPLAELASRLLYINVPPGPPPTATPIDYLAAFDDDARPHGDKKK